MTNTQKSQYDYLLKLVSRIPKSEIQLQSKCAELLYWFYPNDWQRLVCVNNNDRRANTQGVGIVSGASDTYWLAAKGVTIYIEFKFGNNKQSPKQIEWEELCDSLNHTYEVCYSEQYFWYLIGFKQPAATDVLLLNWFG